jgi:Ser/Thr protein kinase RdoA (MazF antagonist)
MIVSFLEGKAKSNLSPDNCKAIGIEAAKMHELTKNLKLKDKMIYLLIHGEVYSKL